MRGAGSGSAKSLVFRTVMRCRRRAGFSIFVREDYHILKGWAFLEGGVADEGDGAGFAVADGRSDEG